MKNKLFKCLLLVWAIHVGGTVKAQFSYRFSEKGVTVCRFNEDCCEAFKIPESIRIMGEDEKLPVSMRGLQGKTVPVTIIGNHAFENITGLTKVTIPNSIKTIEEYAFYGCKNLSFVTLSENTEIIEDAAFKNCKNIRDIICNNQNPPIAFGDPFDSEVIRFATVYVPKGLKSIYKEDIYWRHCKITDEPYTEPVITDPNLKRYRGSFNMAGFDYGVRSYILEKEEGTATYYYKDAPDGTRIFEGDFLFEGAGCRASGQFKNDIQVGTWTWFYTTGSEIMVHKVVFDEDGILNGSFEMWIGESETKKRSWMIGTFENGDLTYLKYRDRGNIVMEGSYNSKGRPIGKWTPRGKDVQNKDCIVMYDNDGDVIESYYVDETTGDKIRINVKAPLEAYPIVRSSISKCIFRSTPGLKNAHF